MPSLTDLFNPTFLMFLGILVLVVALLVVYFETKFRDQNHKISSMLSLVSSLAEEVNGSKMIIHQLTMNHQPQNQPFFQYQQPNLEKRIVQNDNLILVSDDEEDSEADSEVDDASEASDSDSDAASEVSIDENNDDSDNSVIELGDHSNDVKVLKLNISDNISESGDEASLEDLDEMDDLSAASLEDLDDSSTSSVSIKEDKNDNIKSMDLKSINITLEETKPEQPLDYRKMALPKLRSIVAEKGLSSDSSKLKKNELLKLLGVE
jgi:outer membrane lipoprotein-sorting protein